MTFSSYGRPKGLTRRPLNAIFECFGATSANVTTMLPCRRERHLTENKGSWKTSDPSLRAHFLYWLKLNWKVLVCDAFSFHEGRGTGIRIYMLVLTGRSRCTRQNVHKNNKAMVGPLPVFICKSYMFEDGIYLYWKIGLFCLFEVGTGSYKLL